MIEVIHDTDGKVVAYTELSIRDTLGNRDPEGNCLFVHELWIYEKLRYKHLWKELLDRVTLEFPHLKWIYWERRKYRDRMTTVSIDQLKRR